jgi:two-component system, chemotaxis family, chemotaxis protein CheY
MAKGEKRRKILVIDDEPFMRWTMRQVLIEIGISDIYEAGNGKKGLQETDRLRPDAVFCDIHMPDEDGLAYLTALRGFPNARVAATPVIMVTSDQSTGAVVSAKRLKVSGYLVKPISIDAVKKALERVLTPGEHA